MMIEIVDLGVMDSTRTFKGGPKSDDHVVGMGNTIRSAYSDAYDKALALKKDIDLSGLQEKAKKSDDKNVVGLLIEVSFDKDDNFDYATSDVAMVEKDIKISLTHPSQPKDGYVIQGEAVSFGSFLPKLFSLLKDQGKEISKLDHDLITSESIKIDRENRNNKYVVIVNIIYDDVSESVKMNGRYLNEFIKNLEKLEKEISSIKE